MGSLDKEFQARLKTTPLPDDYRGKTIKNLGDADVIQLYGEKLNKKWFQDRFNLISYAPHPIQWSFHNGDQFLRAFYGGERSGKTIAGIAEVCWVANGMHPYLDRFRGGDKLPMAIRSVSPDLKRFFWNIHWPYYKMFLGEVGGVHIKDFSRELMRMTLHNGTTIDFMSYEQDINMFGGIKLDFVHFDEEPISQAIWTENLKRLLDRSGRAIMTFTPHKERGYKGRVHLGHPAPGGEESQRTECSFCSPALFLWG